MKKKPKNDELLKIISTQYYMIYYSDDDKWGGLNPVMASSNFEAMDLRERRKKDQALAWSFFQ